MQALLSILRLFWRAERRAVLVSLSLGLATLIAGVALLGLSGWFITASAAAGVAGIGIGFDFFRPSAGIRFLALVRATSRYGERLASHDATLRFQTVLRMRLFRGLAAEPFAAMARLRSGTALNRIMADVETLDAAFLRLAAPVAIAASVLAAALIALWYLVSPLVAVATVAPHGLALGWVAVAASAIRKSSRRRTAALEGLRLRIIDLVRNRALLIVAGKLGAHRAAIDTASARLAVSQWQIDKVDRRLGAVFQAMTALAVVGAFVAGASEDLASERIAIGVFAAFALAESVAPLRRSAIECARTVRAAERLAPRLQPVAARGTSGAQVATAARSALTFETVSFAHEGAKRPVLERFSLTINPGDWVALTGPSGSGKSTALLLAAGLLQPSAGVIRLGEAPLDRIDEARLRAHLMLVTQRSTFFAGTIGDNLRLGSAHAEDAALWDALRVAELDRVIEARGGLETLLGEGGVGLSGGETRRLALARAILRRPAVLLLDEPTEGLDAKRADAVCANLRAALPDTAVLSASHSAPERRAADRLHALPRPL